MEIDLGSVHADIGDDAAGSHQILAEKEGQRDANCFHRRVNATTSGESLDRLNRLSVLAVHRLCGAETPRHFEADLKEPAMLTAFEDGQPIWSTLTLKGTVSNRTPAGIHRILWRIPNETMTSERVYPPIPRDAPGGYYLKNVLFTQYFTSDGASIHYNYWSSNWGYAGSHGCLGVAYNEARFAWDWADVGTPVYVFT